MGKKNLKSWAKENYVNNRALNQARNIRNQLWGLSRAINDKIVEKCLKDDPVYKIYKEKGRKNFKRFERVAMCICSSFFFNSARRVHKTSGEYMLMAEGQKVYLDSGSAFAMLREFPEFVVFTELGGLSTGRFIVKIVRGVMRGLSKVERDWIEPYVERLKEISRLERKGKRAIRDEAVLKKRNYEEMRGKNREEAKEEKLRKAKERFEERKKLREKFNKKI